MSTEQRHKALVKMEGGKPTLHFYKPKTFANCLSNHIERDVYVIIEDQVADKSISQLGFYNAGIIRDSCMNSEQFGGWEHFEIANFFEDMFLTEIIYKDRDTLTGKITEEVKVRLRVSMLNEKSMSEFIEKVIRWLANEGIPVKDPELYVMNKYRTVRVKTG